MADTKISALSASAGLVGTDLVAVVDDPAGTPATQKATIAQIKDYIIALGNTWTATQTITPAANTNALAVTGYSLTGSNAQSMIDLAGTWNTTGTPSAIKLNVTDTASNASSLLMNLQVGGSSIMTVDKTGNIDLPGVASRYITTNGGGGGRGKIQLTSSNTIGVDGNPFICNSYIGLSGSNVTTSDVQLHRDAAATFAQRNSTTAQTFRVYNTYTDASNYERASIRWDTNVLKIGTEAAGTGTLRAVRIVTTEDNSVLEIGSTGYDIRGGSGSGSFAIHVAGAQTASFLSSGRLRLGSDTSAPWYSPSDKYFSLGNAAGSKGNQVIAPSSRNNNTGDGHNMVVAGGSGSTVTTGSVGGDVVIIGGPANGTGDNNGGDVYLDGGAAANAGADGDIIIGSTRGNLNITDARNVILGTTTGTKIGTSTSQKIGFYNATPVVQPTAVADATDAASVITQLNALLAHMRTLGLIAT